MSESSRAGSSEGESSSFGLGPVENWENWIYDWDRDGPLECEAWEHWPQTGQRCGDDAYFSVVRLADSDLAVCPRHLGPVLCNTFNLEWPFARYSRIDWIGPGERPPNSMSHDEAFARIMQGY